MKACKNRTCTDYNKETVNDLCPICKTNTVEVKEEAPKEEKKASDKKSTKKSTKKSSKKK